VSGFFRFPSTCDCYTKTPSFSWLTTENSNLTQTSNSYTICSFLQSPLKCFHLSLYSASQSWCGTRCKIPYYFKLNCWHFSTPRQLSVVKCGETNIPAKEIITYAKQTQTSASGPERDGKFHLPICLPSGVFHWNGLWRSGEYRLSKNTMFHSGLFYRF